MDYYLFEKINSLAGRWSFLDAIGVFFAEYLPYIAVVLVLLLFWKKWEVFLQVFMVGVLGKFVIINFFRWIWPRPRPFVSHEVNLLIEKLDQPGFPSGHTTILFAVATVVFVSAVFYARKAYPEAKRKFWYGVGIGFFGISFLMAVSRVFVGVHWPTDILAGMLAGVFCGWLVVLIFRKFGVQLLQKLGFSIF